jgi:1,4-dihydroxy-2-naphthoyl-CoA hydrolase
MSEAEIDPQPVQASVPDIDLLATPGGALGLRLGLQITEASAERAMGTMPVHGNTQPYGLLHGGASAALAETLGSIASHLHAGPGRYAVGVELNITHHRAVREGTVTGVARALHLGSTIATYEIAISDEGGRPVATSRLTCLLRSAG